MGNADVGVACSVGAKFEMNISKHVGGGLGRRRRQRGRKKKGASHGDWQWIRGQKEKCSLVITKLTVVRMDMNSYEFIPIHRES